MENPKPLASLYNWAGQFESYLVAKPEDGFSRDVAQFLVFLLTNDHRWSYHELLYKYGWMMRREVSGYLKRKYYKLI